MGISPWKRCLERLEGELSPQQFNTWIRPLHAIENDQSIRLLAPNRFVLDWINERYLSRIQELISGTENSQEITLKLEIGSRNRNEPVVEQNRSRDRQTASPIKKPVNNKPSKHSSNLNSSFTFDTFVEGKSNQLARAASFQVAENPGAAYNPLFIYGGVGLGKTHLMHAVGAAILEQKPSANIAY
ncbi:MAG: DnaA/Hda family protein, partial [Proteobacteria bacterium]|nr:DnaA/Hda family protein [Pseudomonadota bacterium]